MSEQNTNVPWGFDYVRCRSNGSVNYDSFNGDIEFHLNSSESERWISTKNSYLAIRLRIIQSDETGTIGTLSPIVNTCTGSTKSTATKVSIPYIAPNPCASLFTAVSCDIGDQNISLNQNIAQGNTLYRILYESRLEQDTVNSTNPIKCMTIYDEDTTENKNFILSDAFSGTTYPNTLNNFSNHKLFALKKYVWI